MICRYATSDSDVGMVKKLFLEYAAALNVDLCFQDFADELATLPGRYAPPAGRLILATKDSDAAGCVAIRSFGNGVCEMKRLFVRQEVRRTGLGRTLAKRAISDAIDIGYSTVVLDTLPNMIAARALYQSLGFRVCDSYYATPLPGTIFMELKL